MRKLAVLMQVCLLFEFSGCVKRNSDSHLTVTNGKEETGYPEVVKIQNQNGGICSGRFVSDSMLITAAHCLYQQSYVKWNDVLVEKEHLFIHPKWKLETESECGKKMVTNHQFDIGIVKFPKGSYQGELGAPLLNRDPRVGEGIKIVGFGYSSLERKPKYCEFKIPENNPNICELRVESLVNDKVSSEVLLKFNIGRFTETCAVDNRCGKAAFSRQFNSIHQTAEEFLKETCDDNIEGARYVGLGVGIKRSGVNKIAAINPNNLIVFEGVNANIDSTGTNSASAPGDSGGPMFLRGSDDREYYIGTTYGGYSFQNGEQVAKRSFYVNLNTSEVLSWLAEISQKEGIDFPALDEIQKQSKDNLLARLRELLPQQASNN